MSFSSEPPGKRLPAETQKPIWNNVSSVSSSQNHPAQKGGSRGMYAPLRVHNFRLLFGGQLISTIGNAFYSVALPWLVLTNGGGAQELGIILSAYGIPRVGSVLLGGILSDRLRPRRIMILADIARTVLVSFLAVQAFLGHPSLLQLLLVAIPLGAFEGLFLPASFAMLPEVLEDQDLQAANSLNISSVQLATLLGSGIGGAVVGALQSGAALVVDALSFFASMLSLLFIHSKPSLKTSQVSYALQLEPELEDVQRTSIEPQPEKSATERVQELTEYVQATDQSTTFWYLMRASRVLQTALLVSFFANLSFGGLLEVALPSLAHGPLASGAMGYGAILAAFSIGALLGGILTGMRSHIPHRAIVALVMALFQSIAVALIPYGGLIGAIACMAAMGFFNSVTNVIFITLIQQIIPRHLLGRILGVFMFASLGTYPLSVALVSIIVAHLGLTIIFPASGIILCLAAVSGLFQRELRQLL